jgi:hypothetical protein
MFVSWSVLNRILYNGKDPVKVNDWRLIDIFSATRFRIDMNLMCCSTRNSIYPGCLTEHLTKLLVARMSPEMEVLDLRVQVFRRLNHSPEEWSVRLPSFDTTIFRHLETLVIRLDLASYHTKLEERYPASIAEPLRECVVVMAGKLLGEKVRMTDGKGIVAFETEVVRKCGLEYRVDRV